MTNSPKGREIRVLDGDAGAISDRAEQIVSLGLQMVESAGLLEKIADGASGMKGLSLDKLREVVGDVHEELKLAGERYSPTGEALKGYGSTLDEVLNGSPTLQSIVSNALDEWQTFQTKLSEFESASSAPVSEDDDGSALEDAQSAKNTAEDAWLEWANQFDARYDTWEEAYESAVSQIGDATEGGVSDGFWDNVDGFVDVALEVLGYIGLALAVLGIIFGGPLLAVLGAIVGILTLIGTIYLAFRGKRGALDVTLAVIGVIPFAKFAEFMPSGGGASSFFKGFIAMDDWAGAAGQVNSGVTAFRTGFASAPQGMGLGLGTIEVFSSARGTIGGIDDVFARGFGVANATELADMTPKGVVNMLLGHNVANYNNLNNILSVAGWFKADPVDSWREQLA